MLKGKKILIGITGGIAAYKACNLVRLFIKTGAEVKVIMTPSAAKFVSPLTLSVLSKNPVVINMFPAENDFSKSEVVDAGTWHINLGLWADLFIIAPATANSIAKIVAGISDNFLLSTVLASRCSIVIAPTMDEDMYKNSITQKNISELIKRGYYIVNPVVGELASGLHGIGKMAEPDDIFEFSANLLFPKDLKGKKILVTAGPTIEPIDAVRYISNYSSGKMGFEIAKSAVRRGADVTLITGQVSFNTPAGVNRINTNSSEDMFDEVKKNLKGKNLIIMSAAVCDFKPKVIKNNKIKKNESAELKLELMKTTDILSYIGTNKKSFKLIGFALETDNGVNNAKEKLKKKNLDMIVLNNPKDDGAGFGTDTNIVKFITAKEIKELPKMLKSQVADAILDFYLQNL